MSYRTSLPLHPTEDDKKKKSKKRGFLGLKAKRPKKQKGKATPYTFGGTTIYRDNTTTTKK